MKSNALMELSKLGQSVWLDFIRRRLIDSGELQGLIVEDGLSGVTSNPAIFEKAIAETDDYDDAIRQLASEGKTADEIYHELAVDDIRRAADLLRPVYDRLDGRDGFVSLEVSPRLAHNTDGTVTEASQLWQAVDRPNVLIKVPATSQGLGAIERLIAHGINVNVTLLFGIPRYNEVAEAYIAGLEKRVARGLSIARIASVASFFLSRIDVMVDPMIEKKTRANRADALAAESLFGQAAIASAKVAYQMYKGIFGNGRFHKLAERGARAQRLLWASTSTKNPAYSDIKYVEPLIGPDTINTMPLETIRAYRDHGEPALRLEQGLDEAHRTMTRLAEIGVDIDSVTRQLEDEGVRKFVEPFGMLMDRVEQKREMALDALGVVGGRGWH
jgi:transaldolase